MRKISLIAVAAIAFVSCKKEKVDDVPMPSFVFESVYAAPSNTLLPGTGIKLASYVFKGKDMPELGIDQVNIKASGSVTLSKLRNIKAVIKNEDSVVVWQDSRASISSQTSMVQFFQPGNNTILVDGSGNYTLTVTGDVVAGTFGTLSIQTQLLYSWYEEEYDGYEDNQTDFLAGPSISFGYLIAPMVTTPVPVNMVVAEGDDVIAKVNIMAPNGPIAVKQMAYRVLFADNGVNNSLKLDSLRFIAGNVDLTEFVTFSDSLGNKVTRLLESNDAHHKVYVTITAGGSIGGEAIAEQDGSIDFDFIATIRGIGTNADGDAVSIIPLTDTALPVSGANYVVRGSGSDARARLATTPNGSGTIYNFIWSDLSADPHSALFGVSSGDWMNGYGVTFNVSPSIFHSRRSH